MTDTSKHDSHKAKTLPCSCVVTLKVHGPQVGTLFNGGSSAASTRNTAETSCFFLTEEVDVREGLREHLNVPRRRQTAGLPSDQRLRPVVPTAATTVKFHERLAPGERLRELSEAHTSGLDFRLQISQPLYDRVRWISPNKDRNNGKGRVARPKRKVCVEEVHANGTWAADTRLRLAPDSKFFVLETQNCMTLITIYVPARVPAQAAKSRDQTRNTAIRTYWKRATPLKPGHS